MASAQEKPARRRRWLVVAGLLFAVMSCAGGLTLWVRGRSVGADCSLDADCFSRKCLILMTGDGMCTQTCRRDSDCPDDMVCDRAIRGSGAPISTDPMNGDFSVCTPTGARLRELLE